MLIGTVAIPAFGGQAVARSQKDGSVPRVYDFT